MRQAVVGKSSLTEAKRECLDGLFFNHLQAVLCLRTIQLTKQLLATHVLGYVGGCSLWVVMFVVLRFNPMVIALEIYWSLILPLGFLCALTGEEYFLRGRVVFT